MDRLEAQGLSGARRTPATAAASLAEITPAGRELAERATDALNDQVFTAPGLDQARVGDLVDVLLELRRDAGDF